MTHICMKQSGSVEFWKRSAAVMHAPSLRLGEVTCGFVVLQDDLVFLHELFRFLPGGVTLLHERVASLHEVYTNFTKRHAN